MENRRKKLKDLVWNFSVKTKASLVECDRNYPATFKITLALLVSIILMNIFIIWFGWDFLTSCKFLVLAAAVATGQFYIWVMKRRLVAKKRLASIQVIKSKTKIFPEKCKTFLTKCSHNHPVIFKIALIFMTAFSFFIFFRFLFGWNWIISCKLAGLLMPLIYLHELGHYWAMKKTGVAVRGIYFVPFLGAVTVSEDDIGMIKGKAPSAEIKIPSRANEAFIYLMGPIWGLLPAIIAAVAGYFKPDISFFGAVVFWSVFINLLNLAPIIALDGGGVVKSVCFSIRSWFGFVFVAASTLSLLILYGLYVDGCVGWIVMYVILLLGLMDLRQEYFRGKLPQIRPKSMSWKMMLVFILSFCASIGVACGILFFAHSELFF